MSLQDVPCLEPMGLNPCGMLNPLDSLLKIPCPGYSPNQRHQCLWVRTDSASWSLTCSWVWEGMSCVPSGPFHISVWISRTLHLHCNPFLCATGGRKTFQPCHTDVSGKGPAQDPCFSVHLGDLNQRGCLEPVRKEDAINNNNKKKKNGPVNQNPREVEKRAICAWRWCPDALDCEKSQSREDVQLVPTISRLICQLTSWNSEQRLAEPASLNSPHRPCLWDTVRIKKLTFITEFSAPSISHWTEQSSPASMRQTLREDKC